MVCGIIHCLSQDSFSSSTFQTVLQLVHCMVPASGFRPKYGTYFGLQLCPLTIPEEFRLVPKSGNASKRESSLIGFISFSFFSIFLLAASSVSLPSCLEFLPEYPSFSFFSFVAAFVQDRWHS